jgi:hypothetical protein
MFAFRFNLVKPIGNTLALRTLWPSTGLSAGADHVAHPTNGSGHAAVGGATADAKSGRTPSWASMTLMPT